MSTPGRCATGCVAEGVDCRIYIETPDPDTVDETRPYLDYEDDARPGDVLVYQMATRSDMADWLRGRPGAGGASTTTASPRRSTSRRWNNWIARHQVRRHLRTWPRWRRRWPSGIGVSAFDADELRPGRVPRRSRSIPVANVPRPARAAGPGTRGRPGADRPGRGPRWLSVGRLAPNKAHEDTIAALFVARATTDSRRPAHHRRGRPRSPPTPGPCGRYAGRARDWRGRSTFVSGLTDAELSAHYEAADVLVMLSEHEGFGVPLLEAMTHGVPGGGLRRRVPCPRWWATPGVLLDTKGPAPGGRGGVRTPGRSRRGATALVGRGSGAARPRSVSTGRHRTW